jgi:hypothetical protein
MYTFIRKQSREAEPAARHSSDRDPGSASITRRLDALSTARMKLCREKR